MKKRRHHSCCETSSRSDPARWLETIGMIIVVLCLYAIIRRFGVPSLSSPAPGSALGLGTIVLIGVAASMSSCLALVGGLLLSASAAWSAGHPRLSPWRKLEPLILFNAGRLAGYFALGGLIGLLGMTIDLSARSTGFVTIGLAFVMLWLGLNLLKILPKRYCSIPLPRYARKSITALSTSRNPVAPLLLGALTFFVPCGFTQSMQLLALGSGSFWQGSVIMMAFALGTLPALLGISYVSSMAGGSFARVFYRFSGAMVVLLAIVNLQSGLTLTGVNVDRWMSFGRARVSASGADPYVSIDDNGQQIITVYVSDRGYSPAAFSIEPHMTTWVYAIAPDDVAGCASQLTAPAFNISANIRKGGNWLGPINNPTKDFTLACSMGMYRAQVYVKPL